MNWVDAFMQGLLLGGLYAQYAIGMALMFGVMRIVNIAHGDLVILLGLIGIAIATLTGAGSGLVALLLVPLGAVIGWLLQRGILNRVVGADPLPSLIATFGLSIALQNLMLQIWSADPRSMSAGSIGTMSVPVGPIYVGVLPAIIFVSAIILTAGLHGLLRHTSFGRALRATAADREAAALSGVDTKGAYALATAIAVAILGLAAVFQATRTSIAPADGGSQLLFAFEAVIIGGMGSIWGAFFGAMVLGVAQVVGSRLDPGWGILLGHIVFLVVLATRPQGTGGIITVERQTFSGRIALTVGVILLLTLPSMPFWASSGYIRWAVELSCLIAIAQMWNLLAGYGGMVSVGQQAFIGCGGYALFILAGNLGVNPFLAVPLSVVVPVVVAVPVYYLLQRLDGPYFAIGTWVVAEALRLLISNIAYVKRGSGLSLSVMAQFSPREREIGLTILSACLLLATVGGTYVLLRSRYGLALTAMRDDPVAASSQGVDVAKMRFFVFLLSAAGTGLAGAVYFMAQLRITPSSGFDPNWSSICIFIVMVGGIGRLEGPIIGALLYFIATRFFGEFGAAYLVGLGILTLLVALHAGGIWSVLTRVKDWPWFPVRRILTRR